MWNPLRSEIEGRFAAVEAFFKANRKQEVSPTIRGLAFVQIYAAYEYASRAAVAAAIADISAKKLRLKDLRAPIAALFLAPELEGLQTQAKKKIWEARIGLIEKLYSKDTATVPPATFPLDGEHFRSSQLVLIFKIFGITRRPTRRGPHMLRIDEVVENRNDIAHGLSTPEAVGGRYTRADVLRIIRQVRSACLILVNSVQRECADSARICRISKGR